MKLHVRNSKLKRLKHRGFRTRMKTADGRKIVARRRRLRGTFP